MRISAVVVTALLALAGCAIQPRPAPQTAQSAPADATKPLRQKRVVCVNEAPLGSHIAERRCRPVEEIDREREATQVELLRPKQGPMPKSN